MAIGDIIVGIDIGTSKVSTVVGEVNNFNQIEIICSSKCKCNAVKKGKIINEEELSTVIAKTIKEAEDEANLKINSANVIIPGKYVTIVQNSVVRELKSKYAGVSSKDVGLSISQVKEIEMPPNKTLIGIIPEKFILDDGKEVLDPVGSMVSSFTLNAEVLLADTEYVKQLKSVFKKANLEIDEMIPVSLAERNVVLDTNELKDNILLLDIGAGNTEIGVFEGSKFIYTNTIPIGGDNITKDISLVLNISEDEADKLKRQYGLALRSFIDNDTDIILNTYSGETRNRTIKSSELIEIIEARVEEIFALVNKDITDQGIKARINNVVLTGQGITNINKSDVAGKIILNIPVKMSTGRLVSTIKPSFRTAYSLIRYVAAREYAKSVSSNIDIKSEENFFKVILERIKEFFYT